MFVIIPVRLDKIPIEGGTEGCIHRRKSPWRGGVARRRGSAGGWTNIKNILVDVSEPELGLPLPAAPRCRRLPSRGERSPVLPVSGPGPEVIKKGEEKFCGGGVGRRT